MGLCIKYWNHKQYSIKLEQESELIELSGCKIRQEMEEIVLFLGSNRLGRADSRFDIGFYEISHDVFVIDIIACQVSFMRYIKT